MKGVKGVKGVKEVKGVIEVKGVKEERRNGGLIKSPSKIEGVAEGQGSNIKG